MRAAVRALIESGNNVILDEMPIDDTVMPAWRAAVADLDAYWVALRAPLDIIESREFQRESQRHLGNARGHFGIGMEGPYDLVLDAAKLSPDQRAELIARAVTT